MDTVLRAATVYAIMLLIFRIAGKRSMAEITTFDFVLTLIIAEAVQQGMVNQDQSITGAFLIVTTLVGIDIALSLLKQRFKRLERILEGTPVVILKEGKVRRDAANQERVDDAEILSSAREHHGLKRLDQIDYAVVERSGKISILPKESEK